MRERRDRGSIWGVQRRKGSEGADEGAHDGDASPKAQHLLGLQRSAGNAAVSGAVAQRSIWEDLFGGAATDTSLKGGAQQEPRSIKGGGMQPTVLGDSIKGGAEGASIKGGGPSPTILGGDESVLGAKGYEGSKDLEAKGYEGYEGSKDLEAKGYEGYEGSKDLDQEYKDVDSSWDDGAKGEWDDGGAKGWDDAGSGGWDGGGGGEQTFKDDASGGPAIN